MLEKGEAFREAAEAGGGWVRRREGWVERGGEVGGDWAPGRRWRGLEGIGGLVTDLRSSGDLIGDLTSGFDKVGEI